jgi:hypothetical protein
MDDKALSALPYLEAAVCIHIQLRNKVDQRQYSSIFYTSSLASSLGLYLAPPANLILHDAYVLLRHVMTVMTCMGAFLLAFSFHFLAFIFP